MDSMNLDTRALMLQEREILIGQHDQEGVENIDKALSNVESLIPAEKIAAQDAATADVQLGINREAAADHLDLVVDNRDAAAAVGIADEIAKIDQLLAGDDPYVPLTANTDVDPEPAAPLDPTADTATRGEPDAVEIDDPVLAGLTQQLRDAQTRGDQRTAEALSRAIDAYLHG